MQQFLQSLQQFLFSIKLFSKVPQVPFKIKIHSPNRDCWQSFSCPSIFMWSKSCETVREACDFFYSFSALVFDIEIIIGEDETLAR